MSGIVRKLISPAWGETLLITESQSLSWQTPDGADIPTGVKNNRFSRISQMMLHPGLVINSRKSGIEISHYKQPVNILADIFTCLISFIKAKYVTDTQSVYLTVDSQCGDYFTQILTTWWVNIYVRQALIVKCFWMPFKR